MAFTLTPKNKSILRAIEKRPVVAIDIEGIDLIYTSNQVLEPIFWDEGLFWDDGLFWDGTKPKNDARAYIDITGSTNSITQTIYPDREGASSISAATFKIVDKDSEVSRKLSLNSTNEIIGKKADFYLGFQGGIWPDDFIPVYRGVITTYYYRSGSVFLDISHPEKLKQQKILTQFTTETASGIDSTQTNIPVETTDNFTVSQDILRSFIRINDEIMEVTGVGPTEFTVIRGRLGSLADSHDLEDEVTSIYELSGFPLEIAQKLMLSDGDQSFRDSDIELESFVLVSPSETIPNAMIFNHPDIQETTGLVEGDTIEVDTKGQFTVSSFGKIPASRKSYIVVQENLVSEASIGQNWRWRSQYNTLNFGLGMQTFQVDNESIDQIKREFTADFIENTFYIEETLDAREFINKQLAFVSSVYSIPRKARASFRKLSPPLSIENVPILDSNNVQNMIELSPKRSSDEYYYNNVVYKFAKSVFDGEYKSITQFIRGNSINRFNLGSYQLEIEADGLRRSSETTQTISRLAAAYLNRFENTAPIIKDVKLSLSDGFNLEVGDVVYFGGSNTKLPSFDTGNRNLPLEKYEILNKKLDLRRGVSIDLLNTGFSTQGIYAVISPASRVNTGSTTTKLILSKPNNLDEVTFEPEKYELLVGARFLVRSEDYTYMEETTLLSFDAQNNSAVNIEALPTTPPVDAIFELANHPTQPSFTSDLGKYIKTKYGFSMEQQEITSVTNDATFEVSNVLEFFIGQRVGVHSQDFTRDEINAEILNITINTIELTTDLPFTPQPGDFLEQYAYEDQDGYLIL